MRSDDGHYAHPATHTAFKDGQEFEAAGAIDQGPCIELRHLTRIIDKYGPDKLTAHVLSLQWAFADPAPIEIDEAVLAKVGTDEQRDEPV